MIHYVLKIQGIKLSDLISNLKVASYFLSRQFSQWYEFFLTFKNSLFYSYIYEMHIYNIAFSASAPSFCKIMIWKQHLFQIFLKSFIHNEISYLKCIEFATIQSYCIAICKHAELIRLKIYAGIDIKNYP